MVERLVPGEPEWFAHAAHHLGRYVFAAEFVAARRVLDAGCGSGYGTRLLRTAGAGTVVGIDRDPQAIRLAREQFSGEGVEFLQDDCERLDQVAGPFDVVCNFENLEHLEHPERFLQAAGRLLTPDGLLLVSSPDRAASPPFVEGRPRNRFHVTEWYREEFERLLSPYFSQVEVRVQVTATSLVLRRQAVEALRQGFLVSNPLLALLWRKWPPWRKHDRAWRQLAGLAAASVADYPILPSATASLFGIPAFHIALCRGPKE